MATIKGLYEKVSSLNAGNVAVESLDSTSETIADLNRQQLFEGKNAKGGQVGQYRNELYAEEKHRMNPVPGFGNVDLKLTGAFQSRITTNVFGETVITQSTDEKADELARKYGDDIYGLNPTFKARYQVETLGPEFRRRITELTGLKFGL